MIRSDPEHEQRLDTAPLLSRAHRLSGQIEQRVQDAHEQAEVVTGNGRFDVAISEQWTPIYAVATSDAHGWQLVNPGDDEDADGDGDGDGDGSGPHLAEEAYPGDLGHIVFENGWVHVGDDRWFYDEDESLREDLRQLKQARESEFDRADEMETDAFVADKRITMHRGYGGNEMPGWWRFKPTGYVGRPPAVVAHAKGYDLARGAEPEPDESENASESGGDQ